MSDASITLNNILVQILLKSNMLKVLNICITSHAHNCFYDIKGIRTILMVLHCKTVNTGFVLKGHYMIITVIIP
jgi:hypothetical protein